MDSLNDTYSAIHEALDTGDVERALTLTEQLLRAFPTYIDVQRLRGEAHLQAQQYPEAITVYERVLQADPEHIDALYGIGIAHHHLDHHAEAQAAFKRALDVEPGLREVRVLVKQLYPDLRFGRSVDISDPGIARLYMRSGMYEQAIDVLRRFLTEHSDRLDVSIAMAEALWRTNRVAETQHLCYEILALHPWLLKPTLLLAYILVDREQPGGEALWRRAIRQDPRLVMARGLFSKLPAVALEAQEQIVAAISQKETHQAAVVEDDAQEQANAATKSDEELLLRLLSDVPPEIELEATQSNQALDESFADNTAPMERAVGEQLVVESARTSPVDSPVPSDEVKMDAPAIVHSEIDAIFEQTNTEPANHALHLAVARLGWLVDPERSLSLYKRLIEDDALLDETIEDLQEYVDAIDDPLLQQRTYRMLGDAYMQQHRIPDAIAVYEKAYSGSTAVPDER